MEADYKSMKNSKIRTFLGEAEVAALSPVVGCLHLTPGEFV